MTPIEIIQSFKSAGGSLITDGDELVIDAPAEVLTDETLATIRENKAELLELLAHHCPICHAPLCEQIGKQFVHRWCATPGHFDSWRAQTGLKLSETDAPLFQRLTEERYP